MFQTIEVVVMHKADTSVASLALCCRAEGFVGGASLLIFADVQSTTGYFYLLFNMLTNLFSNVMYVKVRRNQFQVRSLKSGVDTISVSQTPFTTTRLLIGQFGVAEKALKDALKQVSQGYLRFFSPAIVIHPLEMVEGGLSEIEERIIHEIAIGAGAKKVVVWVGHALNDDEVKKMLGGS
ncbi:MAG: hypothetical protein PHU06_00575 [Gallionella sp.]|nr:hypothetical protein [Gallionella sp.]MDD4957762.1 hypothetical protein [Gallionella sp.]